VRKKKPGHCARNDKSELRGRVVTKLSFRAEQADFFLPLRSCEASACGVEESLCAVWDMKSGTFGLLGARKNRTLCKKRKGCGTRRT
jgi:hypothetical protein